MIHWENHKKRNDSIIVDLFQGQYQSKLTCQVCQNVKFELFFLENNLITKSIFFFFEIKRLL